MLGRFQSRLLSHAHPRTHGNAPTHLHLRCGPGIRSDEHAGDDWRVHPRLRNAHHHHQCLDQCNRSDCRQKPLEFRWPGMGDRFPPKAYATVHIPIVVSRHPLWDDKDEAYDPENERVLDQARMTPTTTVSTAEPVGIATIPGDTPSLLCSQPSPCSCSLLRSSFSSSGLPWQRSWRPSASVGIGCGHPRRRLPDGNTRRVAPFRQGASM